MATLIGSLDCEGQEVLLARLYGNVEFAARLHSGFAAIRIDHELRVDQIPMSVQEPLNAIGVPTRLFVSCKRHDHVACGMKPFPLQTHETYGHGHVLALHVDHAASI